MAEETTSQAQQPQQQQSNKRKYRNNPSKQKSEKTEFDLEFEKALERAENVQARKIPVRVKKQFHEKNLQSTFKELNKELHDQRMEELEAENDLRAQIAESRAKYKQFD